MKKVIVLVLIVVGAVTVAGYVKKATKSTVEKGKEVVKESTNKAFSGSLMAAVKLGVPMKCTYKMGELEAEAFVKGKKYRGSMSTNGKDFEVIMKDNCMYNWEKGAQEGFKVCFEPEEADKNLWDGSTEGVSADLELSCLPGTFGDSKFDTPKDVKFATMDEMMQGGY